MDAYKPPFHMTENITSLIADIAEQMGKISVIGGDGPKVHLRKENRIRTIHSSLAIEHNSLSLEQVTAIIDGQRVLGNPIEIKEVQNAYRAYELSLELDPLSIDDLLKAHKFMMEGLIPENGRFRSGQVGVFEGEKLIHLAPPANLVGHHIENLFSWYRKSEYHPLVKSAIFHFEFEFIHPFADGNGRTGRLWHTLLLAEWKELFLWLPVEDLIKERQNEYYSALGLADCAPFVELMLEIIKESLENVTIIKSTDQDSDQDSDQDESIRKLLEAMGNETLSSKEIMARLNMSHRPTFRKNYLDPALDKGLIERTIPNKPNSKNQKYKKKR